MAAGNILNRDDERRLVKLISALERETTGEIRIHIAKKTSRRGIIQDARRAFAKLGMAKTENHNGVLLYVSLKNHEVAIIGDKAIHEKVGDHGWQALVTKLLNHFKKGDFHLGMHTVVEEIGATLAHHFPAADGDENRNELSDEISRS